MTSKKKIEDCFGDQGGTILHGEIPEKCLTCEIFERCHKVTIAVSLQGINLDLGLIIQNGLEAGWLKAYKELDQE